MPNIWETCPILRRVEFFIIFLSLQYKILLVKIFNFFIGLHRLVGFWGENRKQWQMFEKTKENKNLLGFQPFIRIGEYLHRSLLFWQTDLLLMHNFLAGLI